MTSWRAPPKIAGRRSRCSRPRVDQQLEDRARAAVWSAASNARASAASSPSPISSGTGRRRSIAGWVERVLGLDFLRPRRRMWCCVGAQGLGKTMVTKNLVHQAILARPLGRSSPPLPICSSISMAQETTPTSTGDSATTPAHNSCASTRSATSGLRCPRRRPPLPDRHGVATNRSPSCLLPISPFASGTPSSPTPPAPSGSLTASTHHAAIIKITGDSYRLREAERHQKAQRAS